MAGTTWNVFADGTKVKASALNANFDWREGAIMPHNAGAFTNAAYNIGESSYQYNTGYFATSVFLNGVEWSSLDNTTLSIAGFNAITVLSARGSTANSGGSQREIAQGTVSTVDFAANALTQVATFASGSAAGATTMTTVTITTSGVGNVLVLAHCSIRIGSTAGGDGQVDVGVDRDGVALTGSIRNRRSSASSLNGYNFSMIAVDAAPSAGSHSYHITYTVTSGSFTSAAQFNLCVIELKK